MMRLLPRSISSIWALAWTVTRPRPDAVGGLDALLALLLDDDAAGGEVRALDELHQMVDVNIVELLPVLEHVDQRVHDLAQVVRRDGGGHADRDTGGAVDQQVGDGRRQDTRLRQRVVEVG